MAESDRPQMTIWRMRIACRPNNKGYRQALRICSPYAFPRQKWLRQRNSVLRYLPEFLLFGRNYLSFTCVNIHLITFCDLY
jgi:hypothetical protein